METWLVHALTSRDGGLASSAGIYRTSSEAEAIGKFMLWCAENRSKVENTPATMKVEFD